MSKADKMFERLGYKKRLWGLFIIYENKLGNQICINLEEKITETTDRSITIQELQAINQKCRELGWIE